MVLTIILYFVRQETEHPLQFVPNVETFKLMEQRFVMTAQMTISDVLQDVQELL